MEEFKKRDVISNVTRKEVSALPLCDVSDQVACCSCCSLATLKDI